MLKKSLIVGFILLAIGNISYAHSVNDEKVLHVLSRYLEAWKTRDMNEIGKMYAENVSIYDLPSDSTTSGKENVLKYEREVWLASAPDMVWVRTGTAMVSGDSVTYEWLYSGTYSGMWGERKVDKKPFSVKGVSITTINEGGLIILQKDFYDLKTFERQLGVAL